MDEARCKEIWGVFEKLSHMHREPWTHRGTSTADPVPLSTWTQFRDNRYGFSNVIVLGLEDPGTLPELVQYTRGELRGAALERQRVIIPQMVFIKHVANILGWDKAPVYAENSGFSKETIEGLNHFRIFVIVNAKLLIDDHSLIIDLTTERGKRGKGLDSWNLASIIGSQYRRSPGAVLKRSSTMEISLGSLVSSAASHFEVVTHFELPSHPAPMREAEQGWFRNLRSLFLRDKENELRYWKTDAQQNGDQREAVEQISLSDEDEQRLRQLARNMMVLAVRKGK